MNSIGVDFKLKTIEIDGKEIKLQIVKKKIKKIKILQWDTAGQERFRAITTSYYKGAQGFVIVYDITERESFEHVITWMDQINKFAKDNVLKILVGNKCDLESLRKISFNEGKDLANDYNYAFYETSAKDSINVENLFVDATRNFINQHLGIGNIDLKKGKQNNNKDKDKVNLYGTVLETKKKKKCCGR